MMISICPREFSATHLLLDALPTTNLRQAERRMSRTATLDGSVAITDGGWADGDRTLIVNLRPSAMTAQLVEQIETVKGFLRVSVAFDEGVFEALLQRYNLGSTPTLTLAVASKLSE
jgi:hypothetical protein